MLTEDDDLQTVHITSWQWGENENGGVEIESGELHHLYIHFPEDNPERPIIDVVIEPGPAKYFLCQADSEADALAQMKEWDN